MTAPSCFRGLSCPCTTVKRPALMPNIRCAAQPSVTLFFYVFPGDTGVENHFFQTDR
jgi:hypothetical protein